ncbi:MAG: 50S ribosomal protein L32e [Promethearchaeota archaeon]|jgi:large subunit ribosomal protein L32e|nr:MAG: 50S ribosomal protein L32e [Candidatus Lokiarchaeota archaeon]
MKRKKEKLLELRKKMKKKRPKFRRVESWRYKRVKDSWRRAKGIDSQTRKKTKSGVKMPNVGYRTPKEIRGLHPSGYEEVRVITKDDLDGLSPKKHALKISGRLGAKKRIGLIEYAQNRGFKILNLGISQRELEELEAMLETPLTDLEDEDLFDEEELEEFEDFEEEEL